MPNLYLIKLFRSRGINNPHHIIPESITHDVLHLTPLEILKLVMCGRMGSAIEQTVRWYPGLLESNQNLMFMLKCRQFIEMVNGCDFDVSTHGDPRMQHEETNALSHFLSAPLQSPITRAVAGQQTSVIQSTKAYHNGSSAAPQNGSGGLISDFLAVQQQQQMDCVVGGGEAEGASVKSNSNNHNYAAGAVDSDSLLQQQQNHVVEMNNLLNAYANNGAGGGQDGGGGTEFLMNDVEMENGNGHAVSSSSNGKFGEVVKGITCKIL